MAVSCCGKRPCARCKSRGIICEDYKPKPRKPRRPRQSLADRFALLGLPLKDQYKKKAAGKVMVMMMTMMMRRMMMMIMIAML
jgi:hypothetical protein